MAFTTGPWAGVDLTKRGFYTFPPAPHPTYAVTRRTGVVTAKALGRPKPAVIGTGKVEGIPIYGELAAVTTLPVEGLPWWESYEVVPEATTVITVDVAYLLAHDYFDVEHKLIRLECDGKVVFDAENGGKPSGEFRFLDGTQETVDPLFTRIVGANAGAHKRDIIVVLVNYPAAQPPSVAAVLSNAATDTGSSEELEWVGPTPFNLNWISGQAYDPIDGIIYQILGSDQIAVSQNWLASIDVDTGAELYRVPLEESIEYVGGAGDFIIALPGTGHVVIRFAIIAEGDSPTRVYNASTGRIVAEFREETSIGANDEGFTWRAVVPFEDKWLLAGIDVVAADGFPHALAVIDIAAGTIDVTRETITGAGSFFCNGRVLDGSSSVFTSGGSIVKECTFDGDTWTVTTAYTAVGTITAIHYDSQTEYLVVVESVAGVFVVQLVRPSTGQIADQFDSFASPSLFNIYNALSGPRAFPRPGFAMLHAPDNNVYLLDLSRKTKAVFVDADTTVPGIDASWAFYDHSRLAMLNAYGDTIWTKYQIPGTTPGQITLQSHIEMVCNGLGPYELVELNFDGFTGLSSWGDVIDSDISIRTLLRTYQDVLGFTWADTGVNLHFRKPATDGSFTEDYVLADTDLVFKTGGSIRTSDASDLARVVKVNMEYVSKDNNYEVETRSADSFSALYDVSRSLRTDDVSTRLVLSDSDAERLVHEILWRRQIEERGHQFSTFSDFAAKLIPGDIVTVPSGATNYTVQITRANVQANLQVDYDCRDFQTSLSADVASVTTSGFSGIVSITLQSQYIHLDIPLFRYADDADGEFLVQYGLMASRIGSTNWKGGNLYRGDTASELAFLIDQAPHQGFVGICTTVLGTPLDPFGEDDVSSVVVTKIVGAALASADEAEVLAGENLAFVGVPGRWEGLGFTTVVDNGDNTFTVSGFPFRGYRGTEVYADQHAVGDLFVLVNAEWLLRINHSLTDLDTSKFYKADGIGAPKMSGTLVKHQIPGAAETPYAVRNIEIGRGSPGDDIIITWDYRSRLATGLNPVNHGEATLAFEIDIVSSGTMRTLESSTGSVVYQSADIIADWGGIPDQLTVDIYMMSAVVGRGHRARGHTVFNADPTFDSARLTFDSTETTFDEEP